jgi:hypothetical protein
MKQSALRMFIVGPESICFLVGKKLIKIATPTSFCKQYVGTDGFKITMLDLETASYGVAANALIKYAKRGTRHLF